MRISVRINEDVGIMTLEGKFLAGGDGPFLRQKVRDLLDAGLKKLILEFSSVPYIDSTGLGFLAGSRSAAEESGARIILSGMNEHVRKILDDVKLSSYFTFAADEKAAIEKLMKPAISEAKSGEDSRTRKRAAEPDRS